MTNADTQVDVIIIGGGAAGLMCAMTAGRRGRSVIVLEGSNKIGKKILMSGGGRCNFTNQDTEPARFSSSNRHFCKSALSQYTQRDFIALVEQHGIAYHEKKLGQLFCDSSSKDIVTLLAEECSTAGVKVLTSCSDISVSGDASFTVECCHGRFACESLVVASGGLSIPRMGASGIGYELARQFGVNVVETRAGLVPFTFSGNLQAMLERLSGVSCGVTLSTRHKTFHEDILFTHRGLSGPAALQASSHWFPGEEIHIDFLPGEEAVQLLLEAKDKQPRSLLRTVLTRKLPRALLIELQTSLWPAFKESLIAEIPDKKLRDIAAALHRWSIRPAATEGYRTAEVTLGGVDTDDLSSKTMACRHRTNLFFVGEVVDVTGQLGGYNFQWAWSSGWVAGKAA